MNARVRLKAQDGDPLHDDAVRAIVVSTAEAIGERTGVAVTVLNADGNSIELDVGGTQLEATALAAELRRLTDAWHSEKYGCTLWSFS